MKYTVCNCDLLLKPVKQTESIIEQSASQKNLPEAQAALANILFEVNDSTVTLTSSDFNIWIRATTPIGIQGSQGRFMVNASRLSNILNHFDPNAPISLSVDEQNQILLDSGSSHYVIQSNSADRYPIFKTNKWNTEFSLPAKILRELFSLTASALPTKPIRYNLEGALLKIDSNSLCCITTDTHRLASCTLQIDEIDLTSPLACILPKKAVRELLRLLPDDATEVRCHFNETHCAFFLDNVEFYRKLIEGQFPSYEPVIKGAMDRVHRTKLPREGMLKALRRIRNFNDEMEGLRCHFHDNTLDLSSKNALGQATESFPIEWTEEAFSVALDLDCFVDGIAALKTEDFELCTGSTTKAIMVKVPDSDMYRYIFMPLRGKN